MTHDEEFVILMDDADVEAPEGRAFDAGISPAAAQIYDIQPRSAENMASPRIVLAEAFARWLVAIGWTIDLPIGAGLDPTEFPDWLSEVGEPGRKAQYLKNVFWGLTFDAIFQDRKFQGTLVGFANDGGTIDRRADAGKSMHQLATVRILVESEPPSYAMKVAMRLFDLFKIKPGFTVVRSAVDGNTGAIGKIRLPDLLVREAAPLEEPSFLTDRQVSFRLRVKFAR